MRKRKGKKLSPTQMQRPMVDIVKKYQGGPNKSFLKKHGLDENSHPADWFNALMPLTPKDNLEHLSDVDVKGDGKTKFAISNWTPYTNQKASMENAGEEDTCLLMESRQEQRKLSSYQASLCLRT